MSLTAFRRLAALTGVALAGDLGVAGLSLLVGLPLPLDTLGTALAGALGGPWIGVGLGLASGAVVGWQIPGAGPVVVAMGVHAAVGVVAALASRIGALASTGGRVAAGAGAGLATAAATLLAGGLVAGEPASLAAFLLRGGLGASLGLAALGVAGEVLDKAVIFVLAGLLAGWLGGRSWSSDAPRSDERGSTRRRSTGV